MLTGKTFLITGVLMESSIAFHVAKIAQEHGAKVILTSFGRTMKITQTIAKRLPEPAPVIELDVTNKEHLEALADRIGEHTETLDGVLHSIGFAPAGAFTFLEADWEDVATAVHVSAFSLKALAVAALPRMREPLPRSRSGTEGGALQPRRRRTDSHDRGDVDPRLRAVRGVVGWRAPLGWDVGDPVPTAKACAMLLSDWFPATTGEIVHVDGGAHAMGM